MEGENPKVLFVDDEPNVLNSIRRATVGEPFEALFANNGQEALKIIIEQTISVIVTDMRMPGMDGLSLIKQVKDLSPKTIRIVLSGYTQLSQVIATVNQGEIYHFIPKPWEMEEQLLVVVRQAIARYQQEKEYQNVKYLNHWIFSYWKNQIEAGVPATADARSIALEAVELLEDLQFSYIDMLPTVMIKKTVKNMLLDFSKVFQQKISLKNSLAESLVIYGNHNFLLMVVQSVIKWIDPNRTARIHCALELERSSDGSTKLTFRIKQNEYELTSLAFEKNKVATACLRELGKAYRLARVSIEKTSDNQAEAMIEWEVEMS